MIDYFVSIFYQNQTLYIFQTHVKYEVNNDGEIMREDVGIDPEKHLITIETPPMGDKEPALLMHVTDKVNFIFF